MEWLAKQHEATSRRAPTVAVATTEPSILVCHKGKRNIVNFMQEEKRYKFRVNPPIEKEAMAI